MDKQNKGILALKEEYEDQQETINQMIAGGEFESIDELKYYQGMNAKVSEIIADLEELLK